MGLIVVLALGASARLGLTQLGLEQLPSPPSPENKWGFLWYVVGGLVFIIAGLIYILLGYRNRVEVISEKRAQGLEGLLKTNDTQLAIVTKEKDKVQDDLREVETELRVTAGVKVQELMEFWARKTEIEAEIVALKSRNRALQLALDNASGDDIHASRSPDSPRRP